MIKRSIFATILILGSLFASAQQQFSTTNFLMNNYYYNPAVSGSRDVHMLNMSYRNQWEGFNNAPVTFLANVNGSLRNEGKHGYGLTVMSDRTGLVQNTGVYANYVHHFKLTDSLKLGLGIQPGYMQYRVRLYDAILADEGDQVLTGNLYSGNAIDVNTGFHLYNDHFFVMGSVQHLLGKSIQFTTYNSSLAFHYNFAAGYTFQFKKKKFELQPAVLMKYVNPVPMQLSAMLKGTWNKKFWVGLVYRSDDAAGVALGALIKNRLTVAYAYDFSFYGIRTYQSGSHEISLSFVLTRKKPTLDEEDEELNKSILENNQQELNNNQQN